MARLAGGLRGRQAGDREDAVLERWQEVFADLETLEIELDVGSTDIRGGDARRDGPTSRARPRRDGGETDRDEWPCWSSQPGGVRRSPTSRFADREGSPAAADWRTRPVAARRVLTISTSLARGRGRGPLGAALVELCEAAGLESRTSRPRRPRRDRGRAARLADDEGVRFVFTTGGTGLTPDDVTPEATRDVIEREAPGYAETIRAESRKHTPLGILTRGRRRHPRAHPDREPPRHPKAIGQSWPVVEPTLRHAAETLERGS